MKFIQNFLPEKILSDALIIDGGLFEWPITLADGMIRTKSGPSGLSREGVNRKKITALRKCPLLPPPPFTYGNF